MLRYLYDHQIQIGCRDHRGPDKGQLRWRDANQSTILNILRHPVYAGAYVYGRRENNPAKMVPGQPSKGRRWGKPEDWDVLIRDRLPAYITWDQWEQNSAKTEGKQLLVSASAVRHEAAAYWLRECDADAAVAV